MHQKVTAAPCWLPSCSAHVFLLPTAGTLAGGCLCSLPACMALPSGAHRRAGVAQSSLFLPGSCWSPQLTALMFLPAAEAAATPALNEMLFSSVRQFHGRKMGFNKAAVHQKENDCCHGSVGLQYLLKNTHASMIYRDCKQKENWPEESTGK